MKTVLKLKKELIIIAVLSIIYMSGFMVLESINFDHYYYTETIIDNYIPFIDIFVVPYILWFGYIVVGFIFFLLKDLKGYYRTMFYIFAGMYICLIIYALFPNAQGLRVPITNDNIFQKIIGMLYSNDTCTNVAPSIHVYNSIMMYISLYKNESFRKNKFINYSTLILTISICLSTCFIKQHAFIDGVYSIFLAIIIYKLEESVLPFLNKTKNISVKKTEFSE